MLVDLSALTSESDVEQKLLWPLLTGPFPSGFAFLAPDVSTKPSIRSLEIGKGASRKLYYPDYISVLAGLPMLVIEAKAPAESVEDGLNEARLYGNELNALLPRSFNPCSRVISCNGLRLLSCPIDSSTPDFDLALSDLVPTNIQFAALVDLCKRDTLQRAADALRRIFRKRSYTRPVSLLGGQTFQEGELPQNTFGATIVGDYGHIFNPKTRDDRAFIAQHAYVPSLRRQRYIEPIDRLIRGAAGPATVGIPIIEDSSRPKEVTAALRDRKNLENQILLLVGSVGSGKSTFVDYLSVVGLPEDLRARTVWLRVNLNEAPLSPELAYDWLAAYLVAEFRQQFPDIDFDTSDTLQKVFGPELNTLRKGPLALLEPESPEYRSRLVDRLIALQQDNLVLAKAIARYVCAGPGRLLVIALDNSDKRNRDEQLMMFQVAQWVQHEFRSLVVLPIRDVTYDLHRFEPPLDTALKQLVFRIEPPNFADVLQARVALALKEMERSESSGNSLSYILPNGIRVTYPASDQARYLASILHSLFAHHRFVRQVITGLAGRDVRRALEIFLDFCTSGHIGEDEIYKIRFFEGAYILPLSIVARVLLRMNRRFYDSNKSHLKNLVQCDPDDALPDHFVRLAILHWLEQRQHLKGPAGVTGFHRIGELLAALVQLGHDALRAQAEVTYLAHEGCLVAEHLRSDNLKNGDLVRITAAGIVHLQLMANPDYLAACAEDTYLSNPDLAQRIADRLNQGVDFQFAQTTTALTVSDIVGYLKQSEAERFADPGAFLSKEATVPLTTLREAEAAIAATEIEVSPRLYVGRIPTDATEDDLRQVFNVAGLRVKDITLPRESGTGGHRGFAFVEMVDGRTVLQAYELQASLQLKGRALHLAEAHATREEVNRNLESARPSSRISERVFVGNLPFDTNEAQIREAFRAHEMTPLTITLAKESKTNRFRGFAFVSLASTDEAARAIGALDETMFRGRKIVVRPAEPRREKRDR